MNLFPHSQSTICSYAPNLQYPKKIPEKNVKLETEKNCYHVHFETEIWLKINISMYIQSDWWLCKKLESLMFKCLLTELKNTLWYLTTLKKMRRSNILKQNWSWKLQLCLSMCNILIVWKKNYQNTISNNPFPSQCFNKPPCFNKHENFVKHQNVSKYYGQDCSFFILGQVSTSFEDTFTSMSENTEANVSCKCLKETLLWAPKTAIFFLLRYCSNALTEDLTA